MEKIINFLEYQYSESVNKAIVGDFKKWIIRCGAESIDSKRLLYCIAIDTKFGIINRQEFVNIFNKMDYNSSLRPQLIFHNSLNKDNGKLHCKSKFSQLQIDSKHVYCSLVKLTTFAGHYLDKNYTIDDIPLVRDNLIKGEYDKIDIAKGSEKPREVSWVALLSKIEEMIQYANQNYLVITDYLCDRLGLYRDHIGTKQDALPEYVKLKYPPNLDENFYQPSTLDADWNSSEGLYLSYKERDLFGRTRNLSCGEFKLTVQEQVHYKIERKYTYSAEYIGKTIKGIRDITTIIEDADKRFMDDCN